MLIRRDRAMVAVTVMLDVAFNGGRAATVSGMEPLLQALSRAGLLESVRGPRGGYRIGRPRRDIRLADIVTVALAEEVEPTDGPTGRLQTLVVDKLWGELEETARAHLASLTLDDLIRRAAAAGMFAI
jgi:Rrf2 family protein